MSNECSGLPQIPGLACNSDLRYQNVSCRQDSSKLQKSLRRHKFLKKMYEMLGLQGKRPNQRLSNNLRSLLIY